MVKVLGLSPPPQKKIDAWYGVVAVAVVVAVVVAVAVVVSDLKFVITITRVNMNRF